jgi:hypothetical protein
VYFEENDYFGLDPKNVFMFEQDFIPCLTNHGKVGVSACICVVILLVLGYASCCPADYGHDVPAVAFARWQWWPVQCGTGHSLAYCIYDCPSSNPVVFWTTWLHEAWHMCMCMPSTTSL